MKLWTLLLIALSPAASFAADSPPNSGTALITGSDRGIGFALVQEFESRGWQVIAISSGYGSLASVESLASAGYPSSYFYAMSKAALNMGLREFALDPGVKRGVITVLLSPGAVDTDMQRTIRSDMAQAGKPITSPTRTPAEVAHALVLAIEQLTPEQNGKFYSLAGKEVPW